MIRREHGMVTSVFASVDVAFTDVARAVLVEHSSDLTKLKPIPGLNSATTKYQLLHVQIIVMFR